MLVGLDVPKRYPSVWVNALALKARRPDGTKAFYGIFPVAGKVASLLGAVERCNKGFHIEHPKYWPAA